MASFKNLIVMFLMSFVLVGFASDTTNQTYEDVGFSVEIVDNYECESIIAFDHTVYMLGNFVSSSSEIIISKSIKQLGFITCIEHKNRQKECIKILNVHKLHKQSMLNITNTNKRKIPYYMLS